ncbi:sensor histidine kinase [Reinekea blandensis]|uniref:sensor histidine kinase n=1 Tax=Reinekea blandensis TaxID=374838 RepID=UPI00030635C2|nr:ATP-binding protein [Reinekea blandensis]
MNNRSRLKHLLILSILTWVVAVATVGYLSYSQYPVMVWALSLAPLLLSGVFAMMTLNQSQTELAEANRQHSRTKRHVQELQLKIDRFEYDARKAAEMRRIVLNSTQEKDHSLRNMALALDHAMDEILTVVDGLEPEDAELIRTRVEGMKRYSADLQGLARLELKSELPARIEIDFLKALNELIEGWSTFGKSHKVKIRLDNPEEQMPLYSDLNWIDNLLTRVVQALIRMNYDSTLKIHIIGYTDAELGEALRIELSIQGRELSEAQLKSILTEYLSIVEDGQEIGPGLSFVVARRMTQLLNGFMDVTQGPAGTEVLIVLPRNPITDDDEDSTVI